MKTIRHLGVVAVLCLACLVVAGYALAETELVKDRATNVISGKPVAGAIASFGAAQNVVDVKNDALRSAASSVQDKTSVASLPEMHDFSFMVSDPADPRYKIVRVVVTGNQILISNATGSNWAPWTTFDASNGNIHVSNYYGYNYKPYEPNYDAQLAWQLSVVERGLTLLEGVYNDPVAKADLTVVRNVLKYYQYKYADFTMGSLDKNGNGTVLARKNGLVTLYSYRKNVLEGGYAIDLKTGKVYAVLANGAKIEIVYDKIARGLLGGLKEAIKGTAKKELDNDKRISGAMLAQQIKELRSTR